MTRAALYRLMDNSTMLSEETLAEVQRLTDDYPWFHAVRMLYLKNLAATEDLRLHAELKRMAVHIPDRMRLFLLLEGDRYPQPAARPAPASEEKANAFDRVEWFLAETDAEERLHPDADEICDPVSANDYTYWLMKEVVLSDGSGARLYRQELIDSFLEEGKAYPGRRLAVTPEADDENRAGQLAPADEDTDGTVSADESYFTETLARIYLRQQRYGKALEIIKSLSSKYPKKSIYFADQIRYIEKLIFHTKA
jgi:hypothetical protein